MGVSSIALIWTGSEPLVRRLGFGYPEAALYAASLGLRNSQSDKYHNKEVGNRSLKLSVQALDVFHKYVMKQIHTLHQASLPFWKCF